MAEEKEQVYKRRSYAYDYDKKKFEKGKSVDLGENTFCYEIMGFREFLGHDFPTSYIKRGLRLPENWESMDIIVDGMVSIGLKSTDPEEAETLKNFICSQKGKKKNECFPAFNKPPQKLSKCEECALNEMKKGPHQDICIFQNVFRFMVMTRGYKKLLFIGFDSNDDLDVGFWAKATFLKSQVQNPKSEKPKNVEL